MNALLLNLLLGTTDCALCEQVVPNLNVAESCAEATERPHSLAHRKPARRAIAAVVKVRPVRAVARVKPVRRLLAPLRGRCG